MCEQTKNLNIQLLNLKIRGKLNIIILEVMSFFVHAFFCTILISLHLPRVYIKVNCSNNNLRPIGVTMNNHFAQKIDYYCNVSLPKTQKIPLSIIPFYDFTFVLSGEMVYYANNKKYILHKNDAIFFPPGTLRAREETPTPVQYVSFNFFAYDNSSFPFEKWMHHCITSSIRKLVDLYPSTHLTEFYHAKEKCLLMLNYILLELLDNVHLQSGNEHVSHILCYVEEHITETLSLQMISNYIGLSKEYVANIFKREMGKTLTMYINERKMFIAKEMILHKEMGLTEVAQYLGYENYSYFSRTFKKFYNTSPIQMKGT